MTFKRLLLLRLARLREHLAGKRVGICPADYGRFSGNLRHLLGDTAVTGIYAPDEHICDQGYEPCRDADAFLRAIDACLVWGDDPHAKALQELQARLGAPVEFIRPLDPDSPLSLVAPAEPPVSMRHGSFSQPEREFLERAGIRTGHLDSFAARNAETDAFMRSGGDIPPIDREILDTGTLSARCPVCGRELRSGQAFALNMDSAGIGFFVLHRFVCHEEMFLFKGSLRLIAAVYLPRLELFILYTDHWDASLFTKHIEKFRMFFLYSLEESLYFLDARSEATVKCVTGIDYNIAHGIANEAYGLSCVEREYPGKVDKEVTLYEYDHCGLRSMFPGFTFQDMPGGDAKRKNFALYMDNLTAGRLPFYPWAWGPLGLSFVRRLHAISRDACRENVRGMVSQARSGWPVVFVTMRSGRRSWVRSQATGLAGVFNRLARSHPGLTIMLDGIKEARKEAYHLRRLLDPGIAVHDAMKCTLHESIYVADNCDYFISPLGAGLIFLFTSKMPGVIHCNRALVEEWTPIIQTGRFEQTPREWDVPVHFAPNVWEEDIASLQNRNYEPDVQALYRIMAADFREMDAARPSPGSPPG